MQCMVINRFLAGVSYHLFIIEYDDMEDTYIT